MLPDKSTDRPHYSVCSNRPHVPGTAMRPNNKFDKCSHLVKTLNPRLHDTTGCKTGWGTAWTTGWMFTRCSRLFNRLLNRFDKSCIQTFNRLSNRLFNRLCGLTTAVEQPAASCKRRFNCSLVQEWGDWNEFVLVILKNFRVARNHDWNETKIILAAKIILSHFRRHVLNEIKLF